MRPRAIIFDFDGVIIESFDIKTDAFRHVFRYERDILDRIVGYHLKNGGISRFRKFKYIYKNFLGKTLTGAEEERLGKEFAGYVYKKTVACPYVKGALRFLRKYHGSIDLYVASGAPEKELRSIVRDRGIGRFFKGIYGSPSTKEEIGRNILRAGSYRPGEVLFVGDSYNDYEGARKIKVRFIARIHKDNKAMFSALKRREKVRDLVSLSSLVDPIA